MDEYTLALPAEFDVEALFAAMDALEAAPLDVVLPALVPSRPLRLIPEGDE
jgi:hypothetical protein